MYQYSKPEQKPQKNLKFRFQSREKEAEICLESIQTHYNLKKPAPPSGLILSKVLQRQSITAFPGAALNGMAPAERPRLQDYGGKQQPEIIKVIIPPHAGAAPERRASNIGRYVSPLAADIATDVSELRRGGRAWSNGAPGANTLDEFNVVYEAQWLDFRGEQEFNPRGNAYMRHAFITNFGQTHEYTSEGARNWKTQLQLLNYYNSTFTPQQKAQMNLPNRNEFEQNTVLGTGQINQIRLGIQAYINQNDLAPMALANVNAYATAGQALPGVAVAAHNNAVNPFLDQHGDLGSDTVNGALGRQGNGHAADALSMALVEAARFQFLRNIIGEIKTDTWLIFRPYAIKAGNLFSNYNAIVWETYPNTQRGGRNIDGWEHYGLSARQVRFWIARNAGMLVIRGEREAIVDGNYRYVG